MPIITVGPLEDLPTNRCVEIGDGWAVVIRLGDTAYAYRNECLHQASPLSGGLVKDGIVTCPLHFWRYQVETGTKCGSPELGLEQYPIRIEDGIVSVDLPTPPPIGSWREMMLEHAAGWNRPDEG
ncbi:MAG: Rieske (2Fe-2S) protein [Acidimicrobiia bacterium]|nr:Rieske (2Fe-2S) protein [Acidimicrobiia bacterium]MYD04033.1 Rieske (2Fe-2S) protein [Acidimicrobiia bacterium]